jgi:hypothetical protein
MFKWLCQLTDPEVQTAAQSARTYLARAFPNFTIRNASLRATERDRFVFAVFYTDPTWRMKPGPYRLVAVDRMNGSTQEIQPARESPYWLRGRK